MKFNLKKTYLFAVKSALFISLISTVIGLLLIALLFDMSFQKGLIFATSFFLLNGIFAFIIIQYRVERFIYRRVKKNIR